MTATVVRAGIGVIWAALMAFSDFEDRDEVVNRDDGSKVGLGRFSHIWTADRNGIWRLDRDLWFERSEPVH